MAWRKLISNRASRRDLLKVLAAAAAGIGLGKLVSASRHRTSSRDEPSEHTYLSPASEFSTDIPTATATRKPTATSMVAPVTVAVTPSPSSVASKALAPSLPVVLAQGDLDEYLYLPYVTKEETSAITPTATPTSTPTATPTATVPSPPAGSRVVQVHSDSATQWSGETDYWNYVDQATVDTMVDQGIKALTGASTVADGWRALLPGYKSGQGIAVKVNFNNTSACNSPDGQIDALIHPVNAVVSGLKQIGVAEADIWIYDAKRSIPDSFVGGSLHSGVQYFDKACRSSAQFQSNDADALVGFSPPAGTPMPPATRITDVLINATYLINMPIVKTHGYTGVTLGFKNHFGTIDKPSPLHDYVGLNWSYYRPDYSLFVDLYRNPHIIGKTILTIGDGLFAAKAGTTAAPSVWTTFGDAVPNSLFFATDSVAVDCVMCDFLAAETSVPAGSDDYLRLASDAGLGVFERGDPWGGGYSQIDYLRIEV